MVPEHSLQDPSYFDDAEKLWMWKFEGNNMYMDLGEGVVQARVVHMMIVRYCVVPEAERGNNGRRRQHLIMCLVYCLHRMHRR